MLPLDNLDITKPLKDLVVLIEDDDDGRMFTPHKMASLKLRDVHESSKWQGSPPAKKAWTESPVAQKSRSCKASHTLQHEWEKCEESRKGLEYKEMCYLTFAPVMELEHLIFKKCSFNQPPISHLSPLQGLDKPSPGSKSTYSDTIHWLQQSQSNIDHFWKKDTALVKALRQYHVTSNVLEGSTQWKFQKSWILHWVLDVIAVNLESTKRSLDFHDSMPVDQGFRRRDLNLCWLKAVAVKEVTHLTMILILDEDHTHYSDMPSEIYLKGVLCVRSISLTGQVAFKREKAGLHGPLSAISAHMHAQTTTMPIITCQLSTSITSGAAGYILGTSVGTCQRSGNMFSPTTKRALGSDPAHPTKRMRVANQNCPQTVHLK